MKESELFISISRIWSRSCLFPKRGVRVVYIKSAESESESVSLFLKLGRRSRSWSRGKKSSTPQRCWQRKVTAIIFYSRSFRSSRYQDVAVGSWLISLVGQGRIWHRYEIIIIALVVDCRVRSLGMQSPVLLCRV